MSRNVKNTKCKDSYIFYPGRPVAIMFAVFTVFLVLPLYVGLIDMLIISKMSVSEIIILFISSSPIIGFAIYSFPYFFYRIIVNSSGITSMNTRTGESVFQPWSNIKTVYYMSTAWRGSTGSIFAISELSCDELRRIAKQFGIRKGKPVLSVEGNIFFTHLVDTRKLKRFMAYSLRTVEIYIDIKDQYRVKRK